MPARCLGILLAAALLAADALGADAPSWPQRFERDGDALLVHQPQLDSWANRLRFVGRAAVMVTPKGGAAIAGVLTLAAETDTDQRRRRVALSDVTITDASFPGASEAAAATAAALAKALLPASGLTVPLDALLAALVHTGQHAASVPLGTTTPQILLAEQPARLVMFDGAPAFAPVPGTTVQHAINTNWPLLRAADGAGYYLLDTSGWLTSEALASGPWQYTSQLPQSFSTLPATPDWKDVTAHIPPPPSEGQPPLQIFVTTTPAELVVIVGKPQYARVPGTGLYAVQNTDSQLFWDGYAKAFYYLTAGRWFRAPALAGPWTNATGDLPADFAAIPPDGPLAAVLASVPNTPEAREAALAAEIPHLATVAKTATATATYDGAPRFAPIDGTALAYAVNTPDDVIRVGDRFYLCRNGVWFVSASATGPWAVATAVPDAIYAIPPSAPVYNVTYVRLYQVADDSVVYGYTDGYLGEYVSDGVVTWGTGYYYPPYLVAGDAPRYYARPYTYGCDAFYNPLTGTFHRGGYGYGPYGGIGAGAVYVPSTGTYARGAAVHGPYESGAAVEAYNPRTGTHAAAESRANPYASWDAGVVYGPQRAARGASRSGERGSVAAVGTADGAAAVRLDDGERSVAAVRGPGGDWYAGGDGNLYRRGDDGWERYGDAAPRRVEEPPAGGGGIPGLGRAVGADGYVSPRRYVPAAGWDEGLARGLDQSYAARQRAVALDRRYADWGGRSFGRFGGFAGGRYGGFSRGGGRRR